MIFTARREVRAEALLHLLERLALEAAARAGRARPVRRGSSEHLEPAHRARRHVLLHEIVPVAARLEQQLGELAHRPVPAGARELHARTPARTSGTAFADGDRQPDDAQDRRGRADRRRRRRRPPASTSNFSSIFRNAGSFRACASCARSSMLSSAARSRTLSETRPVTITTLIPACAQEADAEAVLDVVALELHRLAAGVAEVDAAVGEHAIDVEADEADPLRERRGRSLAPRVPEVHRAEHQIVELVERDHVRPIARRVRRDRGASPGRARRRRRRSRRR